MRKIIYKFIYWGYKCINMPTILFHNIKIGKNLRIRGKIFVKTAGKIRGCSIFIGNNVCINSSISSNPIGGSNKSILNVRNNGRIIISNGVGLSNTAIVSDSEVFIDEYTNIGAGTCIYDTDFHSIDPEMRRNGDNDIKSKPIYIGKNVFIGGHCIILKGVSIGDNSVIGAGSVVTKDIPSNCIAAGNPCRIIRKIINE